MSGPRFVGRREYFGSLFFDFERGDYIPFDWDATYIFELLPHFSLEDIAEKIEKRVSKESFLTFIQLCKSIELLDKDSKILGDFLQFMPVRGRISSPLRVHLQLTNQCEMNCKHCSQETRTAFDNELNLDEIYKLIDDMVSIGTYELAIGGGDPFLKEKEIFKVIKYACERKVSVFLSTTGLFVGRVLAKKISEFPVKGLRVSFDGSTEKSFDYQRGKGSYRRVVRSIKTLRELFDCPITLHSVLMKTNFTETLSLLKMVQKMKCNSWSVDFVKPVGTAKQHEQQIVLDPATIRETMRSIRKLQKFTSTPILLRHFPFQAQGKRIYRGFGCVGGNTNCYIDAAGNVSPCSFLKDRFNAGNIREQSLKDIWIYSAKLQLFRSLTGNQACRECTFAESCRGGCRARALETGDLDSIDPGCFIHEE